MVTNVDEANEKTANSALIVPSLRIVVGVFLAWVGWGSGIAVYDRFRDSGPWMAGFPKMVAIAALPLGVFLILQGLLKVLKLAKK
jgi:hypothetical protein